MSSTLRGRTIKENMPLLQKCRRWSSSSPPADVITPFLERERDRESSPHTPLRTDAKWKINKFMNFYFFEGSNSVELPDEGCTLWPRMHLVCHRSTITELFTAVLQQLHRRLAVLRNAGLLPPVRRFLSEYNCKIFISLIVRNTNKNDYMTSFYLWRWMPSVDSIHCIQHV